MSFLLAVSQFDPTSRTHCSLPLRCLWLSWFTGQGQIWKRPHTQRLIYSRIAPYSIYFTYKMITYPYCITLLTIYSIWYLIPIIILRHPYKVIWIRDDGLSFFPWLLKSVLWSEMFSSCFWELNGTGYKGEWRSPKENIIWVVFFFKSHLANID